MIRSSIYQVPFVRTLAFPAIRLVQTAALRHPSLSVLRAVPSPSSALDALHARPFSSTLHRRAEEDPARNAELQMLFAQQQKLLQLLQDKPETLENIKKFIEQLQANGIDVHSGKMPSKMDMLRLLMKSDIRESAMKMAATLQEAGIDLQSKEMLQSLLAMQKQLEDKK
ncbi:hypothetical protein BD414DRAFT_473674 [Trametes punicea]|nr:hypothetical protein BD414DRAFT_473674 [Trametes punicea]